MSFAPPRDAAVYVNGSALNNPTFDVDRVGVLITSIDGWDDGVDVRVDSAPRPSQDGEKAYNLKLGGKSFTIEGILLGATYDDFYARAKSLAALLIPSQAEAVVKVPDPSVTVRDSVYSDGMVGYHRASARVVAALVWGERVGKFGQSFQVAFRQSDPRRYADQAQTPSTGAVVTSGGFTSPITSPLSAGDPASAGAISYVNGGNYETPFVARIYGPVTNPQIADSSGAWKIAFSGLSLMSGEYVEVDMLNRTALVNADATRNVFKFVDFTATTWGFLRAGASTVTLTGVGLADPAYLQITARDAYI